MSQYVVDGSVEMVGYQKITVSTTAIGFTEAKYSKTGKLANCVSIRVTDAIRYTLDNTNTDLTLSSTVGMPWAETDGDLVIPLNDLSKFRMIRDTTTASDVTADCLFLIR